MKKRFFLIFFIMIFIGRMYGGGKIIKLSLQDCISQALKKNLDLKIETLSFEQAEKSLLSFKGLFIPELSLNYSKRKTKSPASSFLDGANISKTETDNYEFQLMEKTPTGGNFRLTLSQSKTETNNRFYGFNPSYNSRLTFAFTQPLLKGFGLTVTKKEILIAANTRESSFYSLKQKVIDTIFRVEQAYWNLVYARMNLKVQQDALALAKDLLAKNEKQVKVGTLAPIEIMVAKSEVASRESEIIRSKAAIKSAEDNLKRILNIKKFEGSWDFEIIPVDNPKTEINFRIPPIKEAIKIAKKHNPTIKQLEFSLKSRGIDVKYAKNQLLPSLDFQASYWTTGVAGDRIIYENNDFFTGNIIAIIKGNSSDALKDVIKALYNNWSVSLNLKIPLSNSALKARYASSKIEFEKAVLQIKSAEQSVIQEIRNAIMEVETNLRMVKATALARELAKSKLDAEEKKLMTGLSTNYQVVQYQKDYEQAKSSEVKAIVDLNIAILKFKKALGTLLEDRGIKFKNIIER